MHWTKTLSIEFIGPILANSTIGYSMYLLTDSYLLGLLASTIIFIINWKLGLSSLCVYGIFSPIPPVPVVPSFR